MPIIEIGAESPVKDPKKTIALSALVLGGLSFLFVKGAGRAIRKADAQITRARLRENLTKTSELPAIESMEEIVFGRKR